MPQKTIELSNTGFLRPPYIRGDRDFDGNGPRIWISTRLFVSELRKIKAQVWMRFAENRYDWTTAEGTFSVDVYDGTYEGIARINSILSPGVSSYFTMEQEGGHEPFARPEDLGPAREYYIIGDTRGPEAGMRSGAEIRFRPITIDYEEDETGPGSRPVYADPIQYIPPHTRGDRDFAGHGPHVWCNVSLQIRNATEIWAEVYMKALETRRDWTTAEGSETFLVHANERPIAEILTDTYSDYYYQDTNHLEDVAVLGAGELVRSFTFTGDTRGDEAGTRTGVVITFNPILIREG